MRGVPLTSLVPGSQKRQRTAAVHNLAEFLAPNPGEAFRADSRRLTSAATIVKI